MNILGLIGARAGSIRCPGKNTRRLPDGTTLISRALERAIQAGFCPGVSLFISSDDPQILEIARSLGGSLLVAIDRPPELATSTSRDSDWIAHALETVGGTWDAVTLIRPTSPFLSAETVRHGLDMYHPTCHCVKTVRKVDEDIRKMWRTFKAGPGDSEEHALPLVTLMGNVDSTYHPWDYPSVTTGTYIQTGGLDIVPVSNIQRGFLVGDHQIQPLIVEGLEALDVNTETDWQHAEQAIKEQGAA